MKTVPIRQLKGLRGKKVLVRVAYDITLEKSGSGWRVPDDTRIRATLPTINYLLKQGASLVFLSWLKRPGGKVVDKYRMDPVARRLSQLLKKPVKKVNDCIGPKVYRQSQSLKPGEMLMLENVRFHPGEETNDRSFSKLLVHGIDLIVFDAFAQAHRVHASTTGILKHCPVSLGFLMEDEMKYLSKVANRPKKPLVLILGGAKISDKISVLERLIRQADKVLIGGGVANVFLKALNVPVGASFVEDVFVDKARRAQVSSVKLAKKIYKQHRHKILLPVDLIAGTALDKRAMVETIDLESTHNIRSNWKFLDIGPHTIAQYMAEIKRAGTIFWNGPMGVFELEKFGYGTKKIAQAVARSKAVSVLGGGDTENVVALYGLEGKFDHVSTGGGASLEFLAHGTMPVLQELAKLDRGIFKLKKMRKTRQKLRRTRPAAT